MAITLNGTTGITTPGTDSTTLTVNANNISAANSLGFRNRIINGNMVIDQRNAGASVTPADAEYTVDRWQYGATQASKFTAQQNAGSVTPPAGFKNYLGMTVASAVTVGAGDIFQILQSVEGFNAADLGWGAAGASAVTLSFWVRSSLTGTFGGALTNSAFNRAYPFTYTISAANTWEQKTVTIAGDTSGTWLTTNGIGISVRFGLGVGSTYSGTAGAWAGTGYVSATGAVSVVGTGSATFYITGVQLEAGSVATPFERIDIGSQLIQCQRYYLVNMLHTLAAGTSSGDATMYFPVQMRAAPTYTYTDIAGNVSKYSDSGGNNLSYNIDVSGTYVWGFRLQAALSRTASWIEINYKFSSEL